MPQATRNWRSSANSSSASTCHQLQTNDTAASKTQGTASGPGSSTEPRFVVTRPAPPPLGQLCSPRVKFCGWLLVKDRIQCKVNLRRKHILQDVICAICGDAEETGDHIIARCRFATSFWRRIGWQVWPLAQRMNRGRLTRRHTFPANSQAPLSASAVGSSGSTCMMWCSMAFPPISTDCLQPAKMGPVPGTAISLVTRPLWPSNGALS